MDDDHEDHIVVKDGLGPEILPLMVTIKNDIIVCLNTMNHAYAQRGIKLEICPTALRAAPFAFRAVADSIEDLIAKLKIKPMVEWEPDRKPLTPKTKRD